jgi:hypothetical protein
MFYAASKRCEIEFGNGRRLRVAAGFDPAVLKALLAFVDPA